MDVTSFGKWRELARSQANSLPDDIGRERIRLAILVFGGVYLTIGDRLLWSASASRDVDAERYQSAAKISQARPDILDRNGLVMATDVKTSSLYGEPKRLIDVDEAVESLTAVLPDANADEFRTRLDSKRGFVWLKREITPQQQREIYKLGLPGIGFMSENRRVYPGNNLAGHVLGSTNIDNQGIAGLEKWVDNRGLAELHLAGLATDRQQEPVDLAIDLRVQHVMRDELAAAKEKFRAIAAAGTVVDVRTGEILAMVSLPDFDANEPAKALDPKTLNRMTTGVFEMGSTFKALTFAMALDSGKVSLNSMMDARGLLSLGRFKISDYHAQNRILSVPEVFTYSSNIGTARMALMCGVDAHRAFLDGPTRPAAHRTAGKRRAHRAEALGGIEHRDHRLRPWPRRRSAAGGDGGERAGQWRLADPADLHEAHAGRGDGARQARRQARDQCQAALSDAAQCGEGLGLGAGQARRPLSSRRQDRHRREGGQWPLFQDTAAHHLHRRVPDGRPAVPDPRHARRASGAEGDLRFRHRRLECRPYHRRTNLPPVESLLTGYQVAEGAALEALKGAESSSR